jgi:hypothetical protein
MPKTPPPTTLDARNKVGFDCHGCEWTVQHIWLREKAACGCIRKMMMQPSNTSFHMWNLAILHLEVHVSNLNIDVMERELPRYIICKSLFGRWNKKTRGR